MKYILIILLGVLYVLGGIYLENYIHITTPAFYASYGSIFTSVFWFVLLSGD